MQSQVIQSWLTAVSLPKTWTFQWKMNSMLHLAKILFLNTPVVFSARRMLIKTTWASISVAVHQRNQTVFLRVHPAACFLTMTWWSSVRKHRLQYPAGGWRITSCSASFFHLLDKNFRLQHIQPPLCVTQHSSLFRHYKFWITLLILAVCPICVWCYWAEWA